MIMSKNDLPMNFSPKQKFVLKWWANSYYKNYDGIICDGAVRSGKTLSMSISFALWSMSSFDGQNFALCGKTITSLKRNVLVGLMKNLKKFGMKIKECSSKNYIDVTFGENSNRFYVFGGKDESSAALIQGITLAGLFLDEVALMPRSFVEQAIARCSVTNSKLWFNCNPDNPFHWFKKEWIDKADSKNIFYLHFDLKDNPSLSQSVLKRYHNLYSGAFYERFVLGQWVAAEGVVYPMFDEKVHVFYDEPPCSRFIVSCDYGTVNPASFGLWGKFKNCWLRLDEYYYDSKREGIRRTDEEHYEGLKKLIGDKKVERVIVDPSAASFIQCIERHEEFSVLPAKNDVVTGISLVGDYIKSGKIKFSHKCKDAIREFSLYRWDEKAGRDCPIKEFDHAMDDIRYFVTYIDRHERGNEEFFVASLSR